MAAEEQGGRRKAEGLDSQPTTHDAPANARDALAAFIESNNPHLFDLYQICVYRRREAGDEMRVATTRVACDLRITAHTIPAEAECEEQGEWVD